MKSKIRKYYKYTFHFLLICIVAITLTHFCVGCDEQKSVERSRWYEGGPGAPNLHPGRNFHDGDIDKYPDVGFITHSVEVENWDRDAEKQAINEAIDVLRKEFSTAYLKDLITSWDDFRVYKAKWLPPGNIPIVRFKPKWVVIIIRNNFDHKIFEKYDGIKKPLIPDVELLFPYKVGYMFETSDVFDKDLGIADIVSKGFRDEHPLNYDRNAKYPGREMVYDIVVRYNKKHKEKATIRAEKPEPVE